MFKPKFKLASYDISVVNGVKQDSSSSGKKTDNQHHLKCKEVENQWFVNAINYPVVVLTSGLRDHDLVKVNHDNMEYTFAGSSSASQERSSLQSGNPHETEVRRHPFQNGKHYDFEGKRKNRISYMDPYSEENDEHEAENAYAKAFAYVLILPCVPLRL